MYQALIEEIRGLRHNWISPEDVIMAIFYKIKNENIPKDHAIIQEAIFKLQGSQKYQHILKEFTFDTSGLTPYSRLLEEVLTRLETFCILGTINPKYDTYQVNREFLLRGFDRFPDEHKSVLCEISQEFETLLN